MSKTKFTKSDPDTLLILNELDSLVDRLKEIRSLLESESKSSVDLTHVLERTEQLRTRIACLPHNNVDWVGILQAIVCIAQYLTELWK
jgi:septation ring formation regulator EzrA